MTSTTAVALFTLTLGACASFPPPSERLAQAEAGARAAKEMGAPKEPEAALHLKMADDQIGEAKKRMADGDNERASAVLLRAQSDAELSLQLAKEAHAKSEANAALTKTQATQAATHAGAQ